MTITTLFRSIDQKDTAQFLTALADDAEFRFGNSPPVVGKHAIGNMLDGFFGSIKSLRHDLISHWETDGHVICHGNVTYTRHDGSMLMVPFADVFVLQGALIKKYLIFIDASQLYV